MKAESEIDSSDHQVAPEVVVKRRVSPVKSSSKSLVTWSHQLRPTKIEQTKEQDEFDERLKMQLRKDIAVDQTVFDSFKKEIASGGDIEERNAERINQRIQDIE